MIYCVSTIWKTMLKILSQLLLVAGRTSFLQIVEAKCFRSLCTKLDIGKPYSRLRATVLNLIFIAVHAQTNLKLLSSEWGGRCFKVATGFGQLVEACTKTEDE